MLVFNLILCWTYFAAIPLNHLSPSGAWDVSSYGWYKFKTNLVNDLEWYVWLFQWFGSSSRQFSEEFFIMFFFSNQSNKILLFGGNMSWFIFISHLSLWRSDAPLYVTRGSFMRIKCQHTHILKEAPVVVDCNHGRSGVDKVLANLKISSLELDRLRMSTLLLGRNNSCLDTYLHFPLFHFPLCCMSLLSLICVFPCNGSSSGLVSTNCDG